MQRRDQDAAREPGARSWSVAHVDSHAGLALSAVALPGLALSVVSGALLAPTQSLAAGFACLLLAGGTRERDGVAGLLGWLVAGSVLGGGLGYAAVAAGDVPVPTDGAVGLGIALGGGLGVVSNLVAADAGRESPPDTESDSATVALADDDARSPRPADLFDGHPDPVLYVADEGHGPVVRAANRSFATTFDVSRDAMRGTPLEDALLTTLATDATLSASDVVERVSSEDATDVAATCRTADGDARFRLRDVGDAADGYVVYTPATAPS